MGKKPVEIESLVRWCYRDELPKGYRAGHGGRAPEISPMFKYANIGGYVDNWSREPGFPRAMGTDPHPDALAIHAAVMSAEDVTILWPSAATALLGELARFVTPEEGPIVRGLQVQAAGLMTLHARLGNRPIWHMDYAITRFAGRERKSLVRRRRGRHASRLEGELRIEPMASEILCARFEYFVWREALAEIARTIELAEHEPLPPAAAQTPWFGEGPAPATFHEPRTSRLARLPLVPPRPQALPPLESPIEAEARQWPRHSQMRRKPTVEA